MLKNRAQMLKKSRVVADLFCNYPHRKCMQSRVEGFEYCIHHILEDKNSPYKQCSYVSTKNGKRCPNAAHKSDRKEGYCGEHSRKAAALRQRAIQIRRPPETPETILDELDHYRLSDQPADPVGKSTKAGSESTFRLLEYASSSDSDEPMVIDQTWVGEPDSDEESIDSEQEDPLKHAGIYTAEEVAWITRDKLIRLQSLYIDQFKRLQHLLKEKRRKYLHAVKQHKDSDGTLEAAKEDPEQRTKYDTFMALRRYHKRHGKEALLHRQSRERRIAMSEGPNYKAPAYPKCSYAETGTKCAARTLPLSKYCHKHILSDPSQTLYHPCTFGDAVCDNPANGMSKGELFCTLHTQLPDLVPRLPKPEPPMIMDASHIDVVSTTEPNDQDHLYSQAQLKELPEQFLQDAEPTAKDAENLTPKEETETNKAPTEGNTDKDPGSQLETDLKSDLNPSGDTTDENKLLNTSDKTEPSPEN